MQALKVHQCGDVKPPLHLKQQQAEDQYRRTWRGPYDRTCAHSSLGGGANVPRVGVCHAMQARDSTGS